MAEELKDCARIAVCLAFFFFQAEDVIRDHCVTGLQTCALPISLHVVGETARTRFGAQLLTRGHMRRFGELLYQAHESCRRLYECSAPELDVVVAAARRAGDRKSVVQGRRVDPR